VRTRLLAALPDRVQRVLRLGYVGARVTSDWQSLGTFRRLNCPPSSSKSAAAPLRLRPLGGHEVWVRPGTSDAATVWGTFARRYHLPPPEVVAPRLIWDLGANIGLTMAHFACLYPEARVLGVELDGDNVALARKNIAPWADRCEVIHAAVWRADGEVRYRGWPGGTSNYQVTDTGEGAVVRAVSLATLLDERGGPVDYLKVDVEGAERELLRDGRGWANQVRSVKVELHGDYDVDACRADLRGLGYQTWRDPEHWACVVGLRSS
jgi:FkbM family methyltransferase